MKYDIKGLILENTFTSMSDLIDRIFPFLKHVKKFLLKNHWPSKNRIKNINIPILFFMSAKDELIPIEHMKELYSRAESAKFKSKLIIKDGTHNESWIKDGKKYFSKFGRFLKKCGSNMNYINLNVDSENNSDDSFQKLEYIDNEKIPLNFTPNYNSINDNELIEVERNEGCNNENKGKGCFVDVSDYKLDDKNGNKKIK